jgi:hypothetical protein
LVGSDEGVDHEKNQRDKDGYEKLIGAATVEEDDPTYGGAVTLNSHGRP